MMTTITGDIESDELTDIQRLLAGSRLLDDAEVRVTAERLRLTKVRGRTYTLDWLRSGDLQTDLEIAAGRLADLISSSEHSPI